MDMKQLNLERFIQKRQQIDGKYKTYVFTMYKKNKKIGNYFGMTERCSLKRCSELANNFIKEKLKIKEYFIGREFLINPESMNEDRYLACIMEYDYNMIQGEDGYYYLTPQYVEKFMPELFKKYELLSKDKDI